MLTDKAPQEEAESVLYFLNAQLHMADLQQSFTESLE